MTRADMAGVVLAAGAGTRLRPLTALLPKALCPVGNVALVDQAIDRVAGALLRAVDRTIGSPDGGLVDVVAVNVHHHAEQMLDHLADRVHISLEEPVSLGTAGALGKLRPWIGGRDVLVTNADAWLGGANEPPLDDFLADWDRERIRLLCVSDPARGDFGPLRYAGVCLLPASLAVHIEAVPSGLYERCWREEHARGRLELVEHTGAYFDTGTPADYLAANLAAADGTGGAVTGGRQGTCRDGSIIDPSAQLSRQAAVQRSVVGAGAFVDGTLVDSVVWEGAQVRTNERLNRAIRAPGITVLVR